MEVRMEMKNGRIMKANIMGDYFPLGDINRCLLSPLHGISLNNEEINAALPEELDHIILNLKKQDFVSLLIS